MARMKISIADLRPTQLTLGMSEVTARAAKFAKLSAEEREGYLDRKAIPQRGGVAAKFFGIIERIMQIPMLRIDTVPIQQPLEFRRFWEFMRKWSGRVG